MAMERGEVAEVEAHLGALEVACRRAGAKLTHQRREVLRVLAESEGHPDARAVFDAVRRRMPTISFDTVYRTLAFLEQHELIRRVHLGADRARYETRRSPHHHFICTHCGQVLDFVSPAIDVVDLPQQAMALGSPIATQLQVIGICNACKREKEANDD